MFESKEEVRRYVWNKIERFCRFPKPYGRIPNFSNVRRACERIRELKEYWESNCVFSAPDAPLLRLREIVLEDGKLLLAVKPKLKGFVLVKRKIKPTIKAMVEYGENVKIETLKLKVDIFAQGCVAVDLYGNRIGKGSGFGDKEYMILKEHDILSENAIYVVVAHEVQVFEDLSYLMKKHDVQADIILTPNRIIWTKKNR